MSTAPSLLPKSSAKQTEMIAPGLKRFLCKHRQESSQMWPRLTLTIVLPSLMLVVLPSPVVLVVSKDVLSVRALLIVLIELEVHAGLAVLVVPEVSRVPVVSEISN